VEELIRQIIGALNARDIEALEALPLHPEFEFHSLFSAFEGTQLVGFDGLRRWVDDVDTIWDDFRVEVEEVRAAGDDRAAVALHVTGHAKASGVPLDQHTGQVWTMRDGLLVRSVGYPSADKAFAAL
jgi:ketosteroid isomerase-like protein